jgi:lipopolysaccharide transport system permease protein
MVVNLWRYKGFILQNAASDLRHRYAGSAMGVFWNVLNPLAQITVYTVVFSKVMAARLPGSSSAAGFAVYLCAGLLPWIAFSECISRGANAFIENENYLKKLPIPEHVFVAQAAASATLNLLISMTLLFVISASAGAGVGWTWLAVPPVLALFQGFGFGIGLLLGTLNVFFRDIGQMLSIGLQLWMWLTPVVYLKEIVPEGLLPLIEMNPAYAFIDSLHQCVIYGELPAGRHWAAMAAWAFFAAVLGYAVLRRLRGEIRDVI